MKLRADKSDIYLLERIAEGDPTGISDLYDRYKTLVFSLAYNVLGNMEDAEEVTIDVFSTIWDKAETYSSQRATVKVWLARIARNRSIDVLRRRNTRLTSQGPKWADACLECLPSHENPEEDLHMAMSRKAIADALEQLPGKQKEALLLAYFKGYSHGQIAQLLDEPLGTIKTRIRSALQKLRIIITDDKKGKINLNPNPDKLRINN
jgi:RNA polymerase sigma-70 factor (ECF subfamily)